MEFEAKRWMARLVENPDDFAFSLEDMCSKVMSKLTWDDDTLSVPLTPSAWGLLTQMSPAGPITNVLTPLWDWVPEPINPWKLRERKRHDVQQAFFMDNLLRTRKLMEKGKQGPCYTRTYLENAEKTNISGDFEASCVLGMLALVGIFTVAGPLYYFLIAMVHHPEWQRKCQEEVDRVCGDRLPTIADMPNLPVIRACIKETMRWKPTVPTGKDQTRIEIDIADQKSQALRMSVRLMTGSVAISFPRAHVFSLLTGHSSVTLKSTQIQSPTDRRDGSRLAGRHSKGH